MQGSGDEIEDEPVVGEKAHSKTNAIFSDYDSEIESDVIFFSPTFKTYLSPTNGISPM